MAAKSWIARVSVPSGLKTQQGGGWQIRTTTQPGELIPPSTKDEMLQRTGYWEEVLD